MDFDLSEEQCAFQATARAFAREEMMPHVRRWDEDVGSSLFGAHNRPQAKAVQLVDRTKVIE